MGQFQFPTTEHGPVVVTIPELNQDAPQEQIDAAGKSLLAAGKFQKIGPDGALLPAPSEEPTAQGSDLTWQQKMVRGAAPSILGGAVGGALGGLTSPLTGPVGPVVGAMAGAGAGEWINQRLLSNWSGAEPSNLNIALAAASPAAGALIKTTMRGIPGMEYSLQKATQKVLGPYGENILTAFTPKRDEVKAAWDAVKQAGQGLTVLPTATKTALQGAEEEIGKSSFKNAASRNLLTAIRKMVGEGDEVRMVPFEDFRATMQDLGATIGQLERKGGPALGRAKQLYGAFWDDFNTLAGNTTGPVGDRLRTAVLGTKLETAGELLKDYATSSVSYVGGTRQFNVDTMLSKIDRGREELTKLIGKEDVDQMIRVLKDNVAPTLERAGGNNTPISRMANMAPGVFVRFLSTPLGRGIVSVLSASTIPGMQLGRTGLQAATSTPMPPVTISGQTPPTAAESLPPVTLAPSQ